MSLGALAEVGRCSALLILAPPLMTDELATEQKATAGQMHSTIRRGGRGIGGEDERRSKRWSLCVLSLLRVASAGSSDTKGMSNPLPIKSLL